MANVKKVYQPLIDVLNANQGKKVSDVMAQILELASAKTASAGSVAIRDKDNKVVAILDYYFKRWMPLVGEKAVDFGQKANTPTGYNSMSKAGTSEWTKQQRVAKAANEQLLKDVAAGVVKPADLTAKLAEIEAQRKAISATELGFAEEAEVRKYLEKNGVKFA